MEAREQLLFDLTDADRLPPTRASRALFVILCFLPIASTLIFGGVDTIVLGFYAIFAALLIALWVADAWSTGVLRFSANALQLPIVALIVIGLVQLLPLGNGYDDNGALGVETTGSLSLDPFATRLFVTRLIVYLVFFAAALAFIDTLKRARTLAVLVVIFGTLVAFFGILQRLANPDGIYGMRLTPQAIPFGPFINQHHFAGFMELTFGLTFGMLLGSGMKRDRKAFLLLAAVMMAIGLLFTGSRGGVLSFAGVIAFAVAATYFAGGRQGDAHRDELGVDRSKKVVVVIAGVAITLIVIGSVFYLGAGDSMLRGIGISLNSGIFPAGRMHFWNVAFQIFRTYPILGSGLDTFGVAYTQFDTHNGFFRVENAHNDYIQSLSDTGIAGFVCVVAFVFLLFRTGVKTIAASKDEFARSVAVGALAGCFGIAIHSFFDFPLRTPSNALFFLLLAVLGTTVFRKIKTV